MKRNIVSKTDAENINAIENRKRNCIGHCMKRGCLLIDATQVMVSGIKRKRQKELSDDKQNKGKWKMCGY